MLAIALELSKQNPSYEDLASKFFEHFIRITDSTNNVGGFGLWNEEDGFYYDHLKTEKGAIPLRTRSLVGLIPLIAVEVFDQDYIARFPGFLKRMNWFIEKDPISIATFHFAVKEMGLKNYYLPFHQKRNSSRAPIHAF